MKFIVEGEEEVGGASIAKYVAENPDKLKADVALVSDTALYAEGIPTLCIGLRGLVYMEIEATGPGARSALRPLRRRRAERRLFGLIELLAKAKDAKGHIRIPGIYDDVAAAGAGRKGKLGQPAVQREGIPGEGSGSRRQLTGEPGYSVLERIWARPTLEVHGIAGGFTGAGAKTVIPAKATAKVSIRLVPNQTPEKVIAAWKEFVRREHTARAYRPR